MSGRPVPSQLDQVLPQFYIQKAGPYHPFGKIRIAPFGKGGLPILSQKSGYMIQGSEPDCMTRLVPELRSTSHTVAAHMRRWESRGSFQSDNGRSSSICLSGIQGSEPDCMTRLVPGLRSTSHTVAARDGCTNIPLAAGRAQKDENHSRKRRFRPWLASVRRSGSPSGLILSWGLRDWLGAYRHAVFIAAPSMTTPAVTYFQRATSSFRASATIVVLRRRPPLRFTRSWNQRASAESG